MPATVYAHRWLLASFLHRELGTRYAGSVTGAAWVLLHPLALLAIYAFIFTTVFRIQLPPSAGGASFTAFVAVVLWPWIMFSEGVLRGMESIQANGGLIRKVAFPHALLVYAAVLSSFAVHAVGFVTILIVLAAMGEPIHLARLPLTLAFLLPLAIATVGIAALLAALQTLLKDVGQIVSIGLTVVFYGTPILYPLALVPESLRGWMAVNPLTGMTERLREVLIADVGLVPTDFWLWAIALAVWWVGLKFFERLSPHFEDFL